MKRRTAIAATVIGLVAPELAMYLPHGRNPARAQVTVVPGTIVVTQVKAQSALLSGTMPTRGSGSYTFQWYVSTTAGQNGGPVTNGVGMTTLALQATSLTPGTTYYFTLKYMDYKDSSNIAFSNQLAVTTLASSALVGIGGIGDSIMAGTGATVGHAAFQVMLDILNSTIKTKEFYGVNRGVAGSVSGQWGYTSTNTDAAVAAFNASTSLGTGVRDAIIMLGTNDASATYHTDPATYATNIQNTAQAVLDKVSAVRRVRLFAPPFLSSIIYQQNFSEADLGRLTRYAQALAGIANGTTILYTPSQDAYNYFQRNPADLTTDDTHPGPSGHYALGGIWAANLLATVGT